MPIMNKLEMYRELEPIFAQIRKNPCRFLDKPSLHRACERLKNEERGHEALIPISCRKVGGTLEELGAKPRLAFTADTDGDYVYHLPNGTLVHFRLRKIEDDACLVTAHIEPSSVIWHVRCGLEDRLLGEQKSPECSPFYIDP